ncbi:hypothetical protein DL93DRAFT_2074321 [Clavulina sp. PMI_390]|nr:hypothetical protein DL93DRAFT_2074321 [Clavulina sp. PMI_390]
MVASAVLRVSLIVFGAIAPAFATPVAKSTVLTPFGEYAAENVHAVPAGGSIAHVGTDIHLLDAKGSLVHAAAFDSTVSVRAAKKTARAVDPWVTGWTAYAYWYNTGAAINAFSTTWTVPATPAVNSGQTVFLFNSIEPASGNAILQPVLQWGGSAAGGGAYWAIATWYVTGSNAYYTTPYSVSVGQSLVGIINLTSSSGSSYNYLSEFSNIPAAGALALTGSAQLVWATETLEAYGITQVGNYPSGSTVFSGINISTTSGTPAVTWSTSSDTADGVTATVNTQGATNAVVTIKY